MPISSRPSAGPSRRIAQQGQEDPRNPHSSRQNLISNPTSNRAGSTRSSTRPQLASTTRHRSGASPTVAGVNALSASDAIDLTGASYTDPQVSRRSANSLYALDTEDSNAGRVHGLSDWTASVLGLTDPSSAAWLHDEEFDHDYDESYQEDQDEIDVNFINEEHSEGEDLDGDDLDDWLEDYDDDLLGLAEEESLFLEDDFFLAGDEDGDSLLNQGIHHHQALLDILMGDNFSSPSSHPSLVHAPSWQLESGQFSPTSGTRSGRAADQARSSLLTPSRTTTQQTDFTTESVIITDDEDEEEDHTPNTSFSDDMPPTTRRGSHQSVQAEPPAKRRRTSTNHQPNLGTGDKIAPIKLDDDNIFTDLPTKKHKEAAIDDIPTLDLTNATEVPEELQEPTKDNRIKLAAFQCVICMDDVTNLTVTHCDERALAA
ncbi:hypothetical protein CC79DRAFT_1370900 [Sarocladium strictum]